MNQTTTALVQQFLRLDPCKQVSCSRLLASSFVFLPQSRRVRRMHRCHCCSRVGRSCETSSFRLVLPPPQYGLAACARCRRCRRISTHDAQTDAYFTQPLDLTQADKDRHLLSSAHPRPEADHHLSVEARLAQPYTVSE